MTCAGIHMSDIPAFPYRLLWRGRCVRSVANLTRRDGEEFFAIASQIPLETTIAEYELADANRALSD
jgi:propanol-preferring alcohol dehydrogenase